MKALQGLGIAMAVIMAGIIVWAGSQSSITDDFGVISDRPWGIVSLIDLYLGLVLAGAWVVYREKGAFARMGWLLSFLVLGNLAVGIYVAIAARQAVAAGDAGVLLAGPLKP